MDPCKFGIHVRSSSLITNYKGFHINFKILKSVSYDYETSRCALNIDFTRQANLHWLFERSSFHHPCLPIAGVFHERFLNIILKSGRLFKEELNLFPPHRRTCDRLNFIHGGPLPLRGVVLNSSKESNWDSVFHFASLSYRDRTDDHNPDLHSEFAQNNIEILPICTCPQV